jgi:GT2 family glycosyltransferase
MNNKLENINITAIILNYKNYDDIYNCIISLEKQNLTNNYHFSLLIIELQHRNSNPILSLLQLKT